MDGALVVMSRKGEVIVRDEQGLARERHELIYGAHLKLKPAKAPLLLEQGPVETLSDKDLKAIAAEIKQALDDFKKVDTSDNKALSAIQLVVTGLTDRFRSFLRAKGIETDDQGLPLENQLAGLKPAELRQAAQNLAALLPAAGGAAYELAQVLAEYDMKSAEDQDRLGLDYSLAIQGPVEFVEWDPFTVPILTEVSGHVRFVDVEEGKTMVDRVDPVTGKSSKVITESKDAEARPRITLTDEHGKTVKTSKGAPARYILPVNAILLVDEKQKVYAGDVLAKIPRETTKTKDITGGLPRVAELFEVRKPKEVAVISEIDGTVVLRQADQGQAKGHRGARGG